MKATSMRQKINIWRLLFGFLICPAIPLILGAAYHELFSGATRSGIGFSFASILQMISFISLPATWVFGIPLFVILYIRGANSLENYVTGGLAFSLFVCLSVYVFGVIGPSVHAGEWAAFVFMFALFAVPMGGVISALLWYALWWQPAGRSNSVNTTRRET